MPKISKHLFCGLLWCVSAAGLFSADQGDAPEGMVLVPAGDFLMGSTSGLYDEAPCHRVTLRAYYIDRYEVTVTQFARFVRETQAVDTLEGPWFRYSAEGCVDLLAHYESRYGGRLGASATSTADNPVAAARRDADLLRWKAGIAALRVMLKEEHAMADTLDAAALAASPRVRALVAEQAQKPVRAVSWRDAAAYAQWAGKRLPTEAEWERAARGVEGRIYPWGDVWDESRCRAGLEAAAGPADVGQHPGGVSAVGCYDMAGNVWEWCADWYGPAYYAEVIEWRDPTGPAGSDGGALPGQDPAARQFQQNAQGRENNTRKVIRGGGWAAGALGQAAFNTRGARRMWCNPGYASADTGFRCAKDL